VVAEHVGRRVQRGKEGDALEAPLTQGALPARGREQRYLTAEPICVVLPPFDQGDGHLEPVKVRRYFIEQKQPARREERSRVLDRPAQVLGGVHRVRRDHEIELARWNALRPRVHVQIEPLEPDEGEVRERLLGAVEEVLRHVGEPVVRCARGEDRQKDRGGAAGAGADLEDPQRPASGAAKQ